MGSNLQLNSQIENYINNNSIDLHPVQKEIIKYNEKMYLKKPRFWDFKKPNLIAYILLPFAFLLQNLNNILRRNNPYKFKIQTVCVGNIYIGGTGKTSLSIQLNKILSKRNIKTCFVKKF